MNAIRTIRRFAELLGVCAVSQGGTGATDAATARTNLGLGTAATHAASDFLAPNGNGSGLTGITESQVTGLTSDLALKAPLASPAFTGTPAAPNAAGGTNTTQLATTAYVRGEIAALVNSAPSILDTLGEIATALQSDESTASALATAVGLRALDSAVVHVTGTETIGGAKTFSSTINGSISGNAATATTAANVTGTVAIANGGTGQATANAAFNALAPSQASASGKYLTSNGTDASWGTVSTGLTIGTTAITSGTSTRLLYDNAGVVGESSGLTADGTQLSFGGFTSSFVGLKQATVEGGPAVYAQYADASNPARFAAGALILGSVGDSKILYLSNSGQGLQLGNGIQLTWTSGSSPTTTGSDSGLKRFAAAVVGPTNGSSGAGGLASVAVVPTQLSANANNYAPGTGLWQRWNASTPVNVTGMAAGVSGEWRTLANVGSSTITLTNQDAASTAANRWLTTTGADLALAANRLAWAVYDATTACWRVSLLP